MTTVFRLMLATSLGLLPAAALAAEGRQIVTSGGAAGAMACATCHGVDGAGQAEAGFPRLAGLNVSYLEKQLRDFQAGRRDNPVMAPVARALSDDEIKAVAAYYAGQSAPTPQVSLSEEMAAKGRQLAEAGNWDKDIPACFRCHGADGAGVPPHIPPIAGQHRQYIENQLRAWKNGQRTNDPLGLMEAVASRLSDREMEAVAAYLAANAPASTRNGRAGR